MKHSGKKRLIYDGFSLIEVLISMVIISISEIKNTRSLMFGVLLVNICLIMMILENFVMIITVSQVAENIFLLRQKPHISF